MSFVQEIELQLLGDERGQLVVLESYKQIPFDIKRVYYIFGTEQGISRGFHAHKQLKQVAVCVKGKCRMLLDNGYERKEVIMDSQTKGILIEDMVWREMHDFSEDCILMVLASENYDESDYIRDYDNFLKAVSI